MLRLSSSEELDILSINAGDIEDSPPLFPAYDELLEVVTGQSRSMKRIEKASLMSTSCKLEHNLQVRDCLSFPISILRYREKTILFPYFQPHGFQLFIDPGAQGEWLWGDA